VHKHDVNEKIAPIQISYAEAAMQVHTMTHGDEDEVIEEAGHGPHHRVITTIIEDLAEYPKLYAEINLSQQEVDVSIDKLNLTNEDLVSLLAPPLETTVVPHHSVEDITMRLVTECIPNEVSIPESIATAGKPTNSTTTCSIQKQFVSSSQPSLFKSCLQPSSTPIQALVQAYPGQSPQAPLLLHAHTLHTLARSQLLHLAILHHLNQAIYLFKSKPSQKLSTSSSQTSSSHPIPAQSITLTLQHGILPALTAWCNQSPYSIV
jgi:hypothetical protein